MIAKIPPKRRDGKSSFHDLCDYIIGITKNKKNENVLYVGMRNLQTDSPYYASIEMEALATENTRCKDPAFHFILSWREHEFPTMEQAEVAVGMALKELDLQGCQTLWTLQGDTQNIHAHVAVNRIEPETFRAIQPAGNWTKKALERAARKIELAQGWEIEDSGRYFVTPEGDIIEKKDKKVQGVSQKARDIEAHTGAQSLERRLKDIVARVGECQSWQDWHEALASRGVTYTKKGSGAIFLCHIRGLEPVPIKASSVGRDLSVSKLSKRFGAFEERAEDLKLKVFSDEEKPLEKIESKKELKQDWETYQKQKRAWYAGKSKAYQELKKRHQEQKKGLWKRQKSERQELFARSWKGQGWELNQKRSLMAARQQQEKLTLRETQQEELKRFRGAFQARSKNFSFKHWLRENDCLSLDFWSGWDKLLVLRGGQEKVEAFPKDLRSYEARVEKKGAVAYTRRGAGKADFIDYGRRIVASSLEEEAVLAALQLACQKWGSTTVNGSADYQRLCIRLAAKHNLKLANPELAREVEKERKAMKQTLGQTRENFKDYSDAIGADRYRVLITTFAPEGTRAFVLDRQSDELKGKTAEELKKRLWLLEKYAQSQKNINITPLSKDKHHILIDDLTAEKLAQLKTDGYRPACVIESSPGNFQAILNVPSEGSPEAANQLAKVLNEKYGDPKLSGAVHAHRLPPFANFKPKHQKGDGSFPETRLIEADGGLCHKATEQLKELAKRFKWEKQRLRAQANFDKMDTSGDPHAAYWAHYEDIAGRFKGALDYSQVDGMIGIRMRVTGYSPDQVRDAIEQNAPAMRQKNMTESEFREKYQYRNWKLFAQETTEKFVFGPRGAVQFGKAEAYRPYFMKLEGRDSTQQGRDDTKKKREGLER